MLAYTSLAKRGKPTEDGDVSGVGTNQGVAGKDPLLASGGGRPRLLADSGQSCVCVVLVALLVRHCGRLQPAPLWLWTVSGWPEAALLSPRLWAPATLLSVSEVCSSSGSSSVHLYDGPIVRCSQRCCQHGPVHSSSWDREFSFLWSRDQGG